MVTTLWYNSEYFRRKLEFALDNGNALHGTVLDLSHELIDQSPTAFECLLNVWRGGGAITAQDCLRYSGAFDYFGAPRPSALHDDDDDCDDDNGEEHADAAVAQIVKPWSGPMEPTHWKDANPDNNRQPPSERYDGPSSHQNYLIPVAKVRDILWRNPSTTLFRPERSIRYSQHIPMRWESPNFNIPTGGGGVSICLDNLGMHVVSKCSLCIDGIRPRVALMTPLQWLADELESVAIVIADSAGSETRYSWSGWQMATEILTRDLHHSITRIGDNYAFPIPWHFFCAERSPFPICRLDQAHTMTVHAIFKTSMPVKARVLVSGARLGRFELRMFTSTENLDYLTHDIQSIGELPRIGEERRIEIPPNSHTIAIRMPHKRVTIASSELNAVDLMWPTDNAKMVCILRTDTEEQSEQLLRNGSLWGDANKTTDQVAARLESIGVYVLTALPHTREAGKTTAATTSVLATREPSILRIRLWNNAAAAERVDLECYVQRYNIARMRHGRMVRLVEDDGV